MRFQRHILFQIQNDKMLNPNRAVPARNGAALSCPSTSTRTKIILVHRHFLHERGHHKGEGLPVEVVEHVANKHAEKYGSPVVSIARRGHGCRESQTRQQESATAAGVV